MVRLLPRLSPPLFLAGPPASVYTLRDTGSLVWPASSSVSAFLLPFPPPLAGARAERRREGADPAAQKKKKMREGQQV